ncbi:MAG: MGMT family protein [FCB group bacterium]|nr:MGMT family protein [FCB group bacterium]
MYEIVKMIPRGKVATYGQIAAILGRCSARQVGFAMAATPADAGIPWHRVINSKGRISPHGGGGGSELQRQILENEGIQFDKYNRVNFADFGWDGPDFEFPDLKDEKILF